jgi:dCMP deaminase
MRGTLILSNNPYMHKLEPYTVQTDKWNHRYLDLAAQVASWSKDPSSKIGAVAVGGKGQILSQGYNGFPRGVNDSDERYNDRPTKYKLVVHAEMNVIYNATYNGVSLDGSTIFVVGLPCCSDCAKGIVQVGIKKIVMPSQDIPDSWKDSWALSKSIFEEAGVDYEFCDYKPNI